MKTVIGIDVSKAHVDVAYSLGPQMRVQRFSNQASSAQAILAEVAGAEPVVVLEATGNYHQALAHALYGLGCRVSVINPLKSKRFAQMKFSRAKTDRTDARLLAEYGQNQPLSPWHPSSETQEQLRQVVKALEDLQKAKTQFTNRQEAQNASVVKSAAVVECLAEIVSQLEEQIQKLQKDMDHLARQCQPQAYQQLLSIPGIGPTTAAALIAQFGAFETFSKAKQVVACAGLNPAPYQSGTSVKGRGGISKRGHGYLRRILYMGALSAIKHNPPCQALYLRLRKKGMPARKALVAVAHKLLRQAFGVVKSNSCFQHNFLPNLPQAA